MRIGLMSFAHTHALSYLPLLRDMPGVEVVASDPEHGERPGESGGPELAAACGVRYVDTYSELFDLDLDAVVICSQNARHRRDVERAAAAGVHVLCEKPLATSVEDARAIIAATEAAGVLLQTAYPVRFSPAFAALRAEIASGGLGQLRTFNGTNNGSVPMDQRAWFIDPVEAGAGVLIDHVVHLADLMDLILDGDPAGSVMALGNGLLPGSELGAETAGLVSIRYRSGVTATIDCSWSEPVSTPLWGGLTLSVVGRTGTARMDAFTLAVDGFSEITAGPLWLAYGADLDALMLADFVQAIRTGSAVGADGASALRSVAVAAAAVASLQQGRAISLDQ